MNTHFTFLYPKEKIVSVNLYLTVQLNFLPDDSVTIQADIPEMLSAPVNSAQIYGTINIYVNNEPIRSISLKAKQSIPKKVHALDIIRKIF